MASGDQHEECERDPFNPLLTTIVQVSCMLVIAHLFHLVFKPLGQPGPVSQILAGLVLSPTLLSRIPEVRDFFLQDISATYYRTFAFVSRILFMFLIGLEMDIPYLRTNLRLASTIAFAGFIFSLIFGITIALVFMSGLGVTTGKVAFFLLVIILLTNSASPVVIRLVDELKFSTSELGRLAITSSLINEVSCILGFSAYFAVLSRRHVQSAFYSVVLTVGLVFLNKFLANWFAGWNKKSKYVTNAQILLLLILLISVSSATEKFGYNSTITGFLLGVFFPRDGKTTRTLFKKLAYSIHNFILPIYFGYMAFQFDARDLRYLKNIILVIVMICSCIASKIIGTLTACHYLKIPKIKGVLLAFVLNLKGNYELLLVDSERDSQTWWNVRVHRLLLIVIVLNTLISGPIVALILRKKEDYFAHRNTAVDSIDPDSELRILSCAYEPRHASGQLILTAALSSSINPYLMHLVELPRKRRKTSLMYNQLEDGQYSDEEDYGGNDVMEINELIDSFTAQTAIRIHQMKIVNKYANIYEDVCNGAEDLRVSIIFLPFHKHQRIDKIMENSKEGYRTTNQKILRHAPCSVGLLVHRNQTGFQLPAGCEEVQHVATLFFGGPDDREAMACSKRIATNSNINLTVIRFLPAESSSRSLVESSPSDGVLVSLSRNEAEIAKDSAFVEDFRLRYVISGKVGFIEKFVSSGEQTVEALREIGETMDFSLLIVGKGSQGRSEMTTGLSDWEECPELGAVGDLLASADFDLKCSILVIQQHRQYSNS